MFEWAHLHILLKMWCHPSTELVVLGPSRSEWFQNSKCPSSPWNAWRQRCCHHCYPKPGTTLPQIDEWVQERGRQLVSQVDEGCQVLTKFSRRATVLGVPLNTLREVKEASPMVVFGKFAFAAFLAAFSKSIIQDTGVSTDWLVDVHCWL